TPGTRSRSGPPGAAHRRAPGCAPAERSTRCGVRPQRCADLRSCEFARHHLTYSGPSLHKHFNVTLELMTIDEIIGYLTTLDGVLPLRPGPGDGSPEIAWGDTFFYYAPDGEVPARTQPFATIVTKNYPGDERSQLDRPGNFRLNISAGP